MQTENEALGSVKKLVCCAQGSWDQQGRLGPVLPALSDRVWTAQCVSAPVPTFPCPASAAHEPAQPWTHQTVLWAVANVSVDTITPLVLPNQKFRQVLFCCFVLPQVMDEYLFQHKSETSTWKSGRITDDSKVRYLLQYWHHPQQNTKYHQKPDVLPWTYGKLYLAQLTRIRLPLEVKSHVGKTSV